MRHCSFTFVVPNKNLTICYHWLSALNWFPKSAILYFYMFTLYIRQINYELLFITFATLLFAPDAIVLLKQGISNLG